jgi:hypothetical protein
MPSFTFVYPSEDFKKLKAFLPLGILMGPMVDRILKILCKFQMGQSQGQEQEDQESNARIDAIHLGWVCKFIEQNPNIQDGLERRRTNFNPCDTSDRWGRHSLMV